MEKRVIGVILTVLGVVGIIMAASQFMHSTSGGYNMRSIVMYGGVGLVFFFAGIGLVRSTRDVVANNEHVS